MKMLNEKPSKLSNIGQDVLGACRHHFDTYNNPEARAAKEKVKAEKDNRKALKFDAIKALNDLENAEKYQAILCAYEMSLALEKIKGFEGLKDGTRAAVLELRDYVRSLRATMTNRVTFNDYVKVFNRVQKTIMRIEYYVNSLEKAQEYLATKTKESFKEFNGVKKSWALGAGEFLPSCTEALEKKTRAVQFGNSLTVNEREYCLKNLNDSIDLIGTLYSFDFKSMAFSFGARGKAGSIAHYQDSQKILAFNRGWSGAFAHELGHAVDYALGKVSNTMPTEIRSAYRKKLAHHKIDNTRYYMTPTEIFARLFEVYLRSLIPDISEFIQVTFDENVMPELDVVSHEWIKSVLRSLEVKSLNSEAV